MLVAERPRRRAMLRWRYGAATADYRALPPPAGPDWAANASRLTRAGDFVEMWNTDAWGVLVQRHSPSGGVTNALVPPLPRRRGITDTMGVHVVKERKNGELIAHWSDYLLLLHAAGRDGPTRLMSLEAPSGEREWAWADIYVPEPEALWMGVEFGGGRELRALPFAEIERGAKPWP